MKTSKLLISLIIGIILSQAMVAQTIGHALNQISTTANFYSYIHRTSDTTGIEIKYFIVKASDGTIKSAFDACDVCWSFHKGYSQVSTFMRCNNCGNTYPISGLGTQGTGGCWPSYLPHEVDGDSVMVNKSDLEGGEWMFLEVEMDPPVSTGLIETKSDAQVKVSKSGNFLNIEFNNQLKREVSIFNLNGQLISYTESQNELVNIDVTGFHRGFYLIHITGIRENDLKVFID